MTTKRPKTKSSHDVTQTIQRQIDYRKQMEPFLFSSLCTLTFNILLLPTLHHLTNMRLFTDTPFVALCFFFSFFSSLLSKGARQRACKHLLSSLCFFLLTLVYFFTVVLCRYNLLLFIRPSKRGPTSVSERISFCKYSPFPISHSMTEIHGC